MLAPSEHVPKGTGRGRCVDTTHRHSVTLCHSPQSTCALAADRDLVVTTISSFGSRKESFHSVGRLHCGAGCVRVVLGVVWCRKMPANILKLEGGEVPDRNAQGWKVQGEKRRGTRKECKMLRGQFEDEGFPWRRKGFGTSPKRGCWRTLVRCSKEDGDCAKPCTKITLSVVG